MAASEYGPLSAEAWLEATRRPGSEQAAAAAEAERVWLADYIAACGAAQEDGSFDWAADALSAMQDQSAGPGSDVASQRTDAFADAASAAAEAAVRQALGSDRGATPVRAATRGGDGLLGGGTYTVGSLVVHLGGDRRLPARVLRHARYVVAARTTGVVFPPCCVVKALGLRALVIARVPLAPGPARCCDEDRRALASWLGCSALHTDAALLWGTDGRRYWLPGPLVPAAADGVVPRAELTTSPVSVVEGGAEEAAAAAAAAYAEELERGGDELDVMELKEHAGAEAVLPRSLCDALHCRGVPLRLLRRFAQMRVEAPLAAQTAAAAAVEIAARTAHAAAAWLVMRTDAAPSEWESAAAAGVTGVAGSLVAGDDAVATAAAAAFGLEDGGECVRNALQQPQLRQTALGRFCTLTGVAATAGGFRFITSSGQVAEPSAFAGGAAAALVPPRDAEVLVRRYVEVAPSRSAAAVAMARLAALLEHRAFLQAFSAASVAAVDDAHAAADAVARAAADSGEVSAVFCSVAEAAAHWHTRQGRVEEALESWQEVVAGRRALCECASTDEEEAMWAAVSLGQCAIELEGAAGAASCQSGGADDLRLAAAAVDALLSKGLLDTSRAFVPLVQPLLHCLAEAELGDGDAPAAEAPARRLLQLCSQQLGERRTDTAEAAALVGRVLQQQKRYGEATPFYEQQAAIHTSLAEDGERAEPGEGLMVLACFYFAHGQALRSTERRRSHLEPATGAARELFTRASELLAQVVALAKHARAPAAARLHSTALNNLAAVQQFLGDFEAAEALYNEALDALLEAYGPEHSDVEDTRKNLAVLQRRLKLRAALVVQAAGRGALQRWLLGRGPPEPEEPPSAPDGAASAIQRAYRSHAARVEAERRRRRRDGRYADAGAAAELQEGRAAASAAQRLGRAYAGRRWLQNFKRQLASEEERLAAERIQRAARAKAARSEAARRRQLRAIGRREGQRRERVVAECDAAALQAAETAARDLLAVHEAVARAAGVRSAQLSSMVVREGARRQLIAGRAGAEVHGMLSVSDAVQSEWLARCRDELAEFRSRSRIANAEAWARPGRADDPAPEQAPPPLPVSAQFAHARAVYLASRDASCAAGATALVVAAAVASAARIVEPHVAQRWRELLRSPWRPPSRWPDMPISPPRLPYGNLRLFRPKSTQPGTSQHDALAELRAGCPRPATASTPATTAPLLICDVERPASRARCHGPVQAKARQRAIDAARKQRAEAAGRRERAERRERERAAMGTHAGEAARRRARHRIRKLQLGEVCGALIRQRRPDCALPVVPRAPPAGSTPPKRSTGAHLVRAQRPNTDIMRSVLGQAYEPPPSNMWAARLYCDMRCVSDESKRRYRLEERENAARDAAVVTFLRRLAALLTAAGAKRPAPGIEPVDHTLIEWAEDMRRKHVEAVWLESLQFLGTAAIAGGATGDTDTVRRLAATAVP